jgi:3(or 17)beta-hydroxysteroid dehydrogenase
MMGRVAGKVAIVTGAARGLGAASAKRLAEEGATVVMTDILDELGASVAAETPGAHYLSQDVSSEERWQEVIAETVSRFGKLDILVNNAGAVRIANIEEQTLEEVRFMERICFEGVFLGCKYALPYLVAAGSAAIVNISALAGLRGVGMIPGYSGVKSGIDGMTRSIAIYCKDMDYKIRVNSVAPGAHDTPMTRLGMEHAGVDPNIARMTGVGLGDATDVANLVLFLASEEARNITGQVIAIDNGASAR